MNEAAPSPTKPLHGRSPANAQAYEQLPVPVGRIAIRIQPTTAVDLVKNGERQSLHQSKRVPQGTAVGPYEYRYSYEYWYE